MKEESSQFFILFILSVCFSRVLKSKSSPSTYNLPQFYLSLYIPPFFFSLQIHTLSTFNNLFTIFSLSLWAQTTFSFSFTFSKEEKKRKIPMAGGAAGRSLEETPTWAVAAVCFVLVLISIIIEHILHLIGKVNKKCKRHRFTNPLFIFFSHF